MAPAAVAALTLLVFLRTRVDPALAERLEAFRGDLYVEPWRLLTSLFVHELAPHLVFNLVTLWILGVRLTRSYGTLVFLALFLAGGTVGHTVHTLIGAGHVVGISGGVCALYGFLLVREWRGTWRSTARSWPMLWIYPAALVALAAADWLALLAIANVNHMIGIATGAMLAWAFSPARSALWRVGSVAPVVACVLVTIYRPWDPVWRAVRGTYDSADLIRPISHIEVGFSPRADGILPNAPARLAHGEITQCAVTHRVTVWPTSFRAVMAN
jgi:membrane associated rhomboid family serine protease